MTEKTTSDVKTIAGTTIPVAPAVTGQYYPANGAGFMKMLAEANILAGNGWTLIAFTRLESSIAVLYRRVGASAPTQFFEEEDADV